MLDCDNAMFSANCESQRCDDCVLCVKEGCDGVDELRWLGNERVAGKAVDEGDDYDAAMSETVDALVGAWSPSGLDTKLMSCYGS